MAYTYKHGDRPLEGITVQRAVGRGGFGEVYYAIADSGKQLALKYLRENPEIELRGIAQVMNLKSPYLITIYDVKQNEDKDPFVLMEYVSGPSLRELLIAEPDGLGPQKAAFFIANIAKGLSYLHERGIVHRDLKPGNIFYEDGYVKIGDYGLSKHISVSAHSGNTVSVGTVHYMAPEIGSGSYSKAIDIYALGVMLYEMLTGRLPFTGSSMGEILMRHLSDRPDLVGIDEPFRSVIAKALAKDPNDRYQDADELAEALVAVTSVSDSIASFDPATLASAPRSPEASDPNRTQTHAGGRRQAPLLDARDGDFPPIPPIPPVEEKHKRREGFIWKIRAGVRQTRDRLEERLRGAAAAKKKKKQITLEDLGVSRAHIPQIIAMVIVTIAAGLGLAAIDGPREWPSKFPEAAVALVFCIFGAIVGPLLVHFALIQRMVARNWFFDRVLYAAGGAVCMIPGIAIAAEEVGGSYGGIPVPIIATLLLFNWNRRIERARRQGTACCEPVMPAVVGLVVGAIATDGNHPFLAAGACALVAMMIPYAAALRPHKLGEHAVRTSDEEALLHSAERYDRAESPAAAAAPAAVADAAAGKDPAAAPSAHQKEDSSSRVIVDMAQPSFVGRAANAGLSFLAKCSLLIGFIWAVTYWAEFPIKPDGELGTQIVISGKQFVRIIEPGEKAGFTLPQIPRAAVLLPFIIGTVLLMTARRNDGPVHFLRGVVGCGMGIGAAVLALTGAKAGLELFLSSDWETLGENQAASEPLVTFGIMLAVSFTLLFWPKRRPKSAAQPIVI